MHVGRVQNHHYNDEERRTKGSEKVMSVSMKVGILVGILLGVIIILLFLKLTKNDGDMKCKYDERQANIRGKGYKLSFFTLLLYNAIYGLLGIVTEKRYVDSMAAMMLGMCLSVAVYAVYCIWNDAYFSLNENPRRLLIGFGLIALFNLLIGGISLFDGMVITDGMLNYRSANLMCGVLFIIIFITLLIKATNNKRRSQYEESET